MPDKSTGLSRFWKELRRRNVLRSLAIYAGSAFIILEATTIIFPRWNFPDWSIDLVLWLLILGAFINVIIAWFYDITPGGMQRTLPLKEVYDHDKAPSSRGWKVATYISVIVIVGLIVLNIAGGAKKLRAGDIQSIVILPFDNFTGDHDLDYFVEGMHASLINDLGKLSGLNVICKTSASAYRDMDLTASEIARELNVDAVVEGSIMCLDDSICSQFRLVNTSGEEKQLWTADYKEDKSLILNLYNRVTKHIADEIMVELTPREEQLLDRSLTIDTEAYDSYLKGLYFIEDGSMESLYKAMEYLSSAIEKDPEWAPLYTGLAWVWIVYATVGLESNSVAYQHVHENLEKALELDPNLSDAHFISAMGAYLNEWNWDKSEKEFIKTLAINPNDVMSRIYYSHLLSILQRPAEALTQGQLALDLDPLNPLIQALYAALYQLSGDCETAMTYYEKILANDPEHALANDNIADAAYQCGEYERGWEAEKLFYIQYSIIEEDEINKIDEIFYSQGFNASYEELVRYLEVLAESGNADPINIIGPVNMAMNYYIINQDIKAIKWLEKGFEMRHPHMPYVFLKAWDFSRLYDNPRFKKIAEKMNLPSTAPN